jgi:hypothetical protein
MVADSYNPTSKEAEAQGSQVWDYPGLYSETLSQNKRNKKQKERMKKKKRFSHQTSEITAPVSQLT